MKWIGLTGGLGSGKSEVARLWKELGFPVLDADRIAQAVIGPGTAGRARLQELFGSDLFLADQTLDRAKLAQIVFSDPKALSDLEGVTHPRVRAWIAQERQLWAQRGFRFCVYDVPLLYEKKLEVDCDFVVVVQANTKLRIQRVLRRSGMLEAEFHRREGFHIPLDQKAQRADFVILNEGTLAELREQVCNITIQILGRS